MNEFIIPRGDIHHPETVASSTTTMEESLREQLRVSYETNTRLNRRLGKLEAPIHKLIMSHQDQMRFLQRRLDELHGRILILAIWFIGSAAWIFFTQILHY